MSYRLEEFLPVEAWLLDSRFEQDEGLSIFDRLRLGVRAWRRLTTHRFKIDLVSSHSCEKNPDVLFFKSMKRRDYDEIFNSVRGRFKPENVETIEFSSREVRYSGTVFYEKVSLGRLVQNLIILLGMGIRFLPIVLEVVIEKGFSKGLSLTCIFFHYNILCREMLRMKPKSVVVFAEMQDLDRVLSYHCQLQGIPCATMQHAQYVEYIKEDTVNKHNYKPKYVTHFFAWGEWMKELVQKYSPHVKIEICGKPQKLKKCKSISKGYDILAILDQNIFEKENQKILFMLDFLAEEKNLNVGMLLHPQNNPDDYIFNHIEIIKSLDSVDANYYISHTTSYIVELVTTGKRVFRYSTEKEALPFPGEYEFRDLGQLEALLDMDFKNYYVDTGFYVSVWGDDAAQNHARAIASMR